MYKPSTCALLLLHFLRRLDYLHSYQQDDMEDGILAVGYCHD
jgi:hypothetical protein